MIDIEPPELTDTLIALCGQLARSFRHWTGRPLISGDLNGQTMAKSLFETPFVVLAHGTEKDPLLTYANRTALKRWETTWERFIGSPSRTTAERKHQGSRHRALDVVARDGYVEDYSSIRISTSGRRFRILGATVWSLVDSEGRPLGQAARFDEWIYLP